MKIVHTRVTRNGYLLISNWLVCSIFLLFLPFFVHSSSTNSDISIFQHLQQGPQILEITIKTDLVDLIDNRRQTEYRTSELEISGSDISWDIKIRPRGKYRRRVCDFPPFKLKFAKDQLAELGFNPAFNKLKVVTHCLDDNSGNANVLKEFLLYQMYNQMTPNSYQVRLLKIHYIDSKNQVSGITRYGFLIEPTDEIAQRIGGTECECMNQPPHAIATAEENLMAMFQYLAGNEDWNVPMLRNIKLIQPTDGRPLIPVPFDFDFAGFVNVSYAKPRSDLELTNIKERYFLGQVSSEEIMELTIKKFSLYQKHFKVMVNHFELISKSERTELIAYLDSFYTSISAIRKANARKYKDQNKRLMSVDNNQN